MQEVALLEEHLLVGQLPGPQPGYEPDPAGGDQPLSQGLPERSRLRTLLIAILI